MITSAGVTSGIDLALALVEEDLGAETARMVAKQLVVFLQRPGGQSQFSVRLSAGQARHEVIRRLARRDHRRTGRRPQPGGVWRPGPG